MTMAAAPQPAAIQRTLLGARPLLPYPEGPESVAVDSPVPPVAELPLRLPGPGPASTVARRQAAYPAAASLPLPVATVALARTVDGPPPVRVDRRSAIVQRQVDATPEPAMDLPPEPEFAPAPVPESPPEAAAAAPPAAGGAEPEELLKTLFDPLLRRLKTELRLDRERRGTIADLP